MQKPVMTALLMAHDMSPMASSRVLTGAVMVVSYIPF